MKNTMLLRSRSAGFVIGLPLCAALLGGCVVQGEEPQPADDQPATFQELEGTLKLEQDAERTKGSFEAGEWKLAFQSAPLGGTRYEVVLELNGATLTALGDAKGGFHLLDGFSTENGADTQLTLEDRQLILSFGRAYDRTLVGKKPSLAQTLLVRAADLWAEHPDGLPLQREVVSDPDRDVTQLCGQYLQWWAVTHDCSHGGFWGDGQWGYASIGERGTAWPDGQYSHHYYRDRPSWGGAQPHKTGSFWAGSCLGRCGAGCPAEGNWQSLTQDCANHDICGTGNHNLVLGIWCQNEAASASDDLLTPIICEGTESDPQWIADWERTGFPNQSP
jgi:hypothetical protein